MGKGSKKPAERRKPVLIVQHAPHEHPAAVRRALESQGIQTHWIHPYRGENYPARNEISGVISLGGPMGANDEAEHPWILPELKLLSECASEGIPVVGICLGGQMLARALGGRVEKHSTVEVGWFPIELNAAGREDPILGAAGSNPTVYQWHGDTFHLPKDAVLLASSQACARQAYRVGTSAYGFQFHPEADHQLVQEWLSIDGVAEEIDEVAHRHGAETVQDAKTQLGRAPQGEKASLKITAAMTSLFRRHPKLETICPFREHLEMWATHREILVVEVHGSDRRPLHLRGHINSVLEIPAGEFLIFQEANGMLWPILLTDIRSIKPVK
ncbi:MAG: type 1 glutamine amidotransferase [Bdellovibrionota bacterium]